MSSMFRSPEDISSSDSDPLSEASEEDNQSSHGPEDPISGLGESANASGSPPSSHNYGSSPHEEIEMSTRLDPDIPELNAEGQAAMMTAALLEFYCLSRAADILNGQPGSHGRYTRDSPEVKFLGRHLYTYKSQFLSNHGVLAAGVDGEDWESARKYYRDNLDVLGVAALRELGPSAQPSRPPSRGGMAQSSGNINIGKLQRRLEGLDIENIQNFVPQRPGLQRRITDKPNAVAPTEGFPSNIADLVSYSRTTFPHLPISLPALYPQPINLGSSRYTNEFEEEALIGKGSYGAVYRAKHHVDGQLYAVKKIPLSEKRLRQLQEGGLRELDKILKEIRTLAKLEHPNVVRYFGAWAECSNRPFLESPSQSFPATPLRMNENQPPLLSHGSSNNDELSFSIMFEDSSHGIVFENSSTNHEAAVEDTESSSDSSGARRDKRKFFQGNSGKGDNKDDEVESLPRQFSFLPNEQTTTNSETDDDIFSDGMGHSGSRGQISRKRDITKPGPILTLHIQMSLHPLSLAKYLNPKPGAPPADFPQHCFHLVPSLKIILGILSGVEYLHATGIVHRDLKPANIFLSPAGPQDDTVCPTCEKSSTTKTWYTIPRIGDFGLVAEISRYGENKNDPNSPLTAMGARARPVGTEFYRPPIVPPSRPTPQRSSSANSLQSIHNSHPGYEHFEMQNSHTIDESLDVFALGVILFELLYRFETRMERQMTLSDLTCSPNKGGIHSQRGSQHPVPILPNDFAAKVNCSGVVQEGPDVLSMLTLCIKGMLNPDSRRRWSCRDVQRCLNGILSMCEKGG
ncbi:hypothetical protein FQN50_005108 [Emmonsiellopsis sp. PD_5]|nr:hypothetical protein FQN50_005108 [Emmonsiellopsis sp. PD_5]